MDLYNDYDTSVSRREVVQFLDLKNPHRSRYEAINLISQVDTNREGLQDLISSSSQISPAEMRVSMGKFEVISFLVHFDELL